MKPVDLQEVVDKANGKPFVYMPHSSSRLKLRVDKPEDWLIVTAGVFMRDLLAQEGANPAGIPTLTCQMAMNNGFPAKKIMVWGIGPLGAKTKFAAAIRRFQQKGGFVICISSLPPEPMKVFWLANSLMQSRKVFGGYNQFLERYCEVSYFRHHTPVPTGIRKGAEARLRADVKSFSLIMETEA